MLEINMNLWMIIFAFDVMFAIGERKSWSNIDLFFDGFAWTLGRNARWSESIFDRKLVL